MEPQMTMSHSAEGFGDFLGGKLINAAISDVNASKLGSELNNCWTFTHVMIKIT